MTSTAAWKNPTRAEKARLKAYAESRTKFIRTTIAEPFPVFYSHTTPTCRRANDPRTEGPFYAAGSEWFEPYSERNLAWKQSSAEHLRRDG
jgi:hypothetical protein